MKQEYEEIRKLEVNLTKEDTRKNIQRLDSIISDRFYEIGASGRTYNKQDILQQLPIADLIGTDLVDFEFRELSDFAILVTYKSISVEHSSIRSSIWVKELNHPGFVGGCFI